MKNLIRCVGIAWLCPLLVSEAAVLTVTNTDDSGPGTLRQQILAANDGDTIQVQAQGTVLLSTGPLAINKSVQIEGPGIDNLRIDGQQNCTVFVVTSNIVVSICDLTITNGRPRGPDTVGGGGINSAGNLSLTNCVITGCMGDVFGGGILSVGDLTLSKCIISNCWAVQDCGGIGCNKLLAIDTVVTRCFATGAGGIGGSPLTLIRCTISNNGTDGFVGGGILAGNGVVQIESCSISGNQASDNYEIAGGGIAISGGQLLVTNTTFSGNGVHTFDIDSEGSAVEATDGATVCFESCTIVSNTISLRDVFAKIPLRAPIHSTSGFTMRNTILAGNAIAIYNGLPPTYVAIDCVDNVNSLGYNLIQSPTNCTITGDTTGNLIGVNPKLGPLQNNGGPTKTHALLLGSPVIGAGDSRGLRVDQRGFPRHATCDMGAFEFTPSVPTILKREFTNGRFFRLGFRAPAGSTNNAWSSPDLSDWIPLGTAQELSTGSFEFIDPNAAGQTNRFYQIRQP